VEAVGLLLHIIIMAMVPVRPHILIMHGKLIDVGLTGLNRVLSHTGHAIFLRRDLQTVPVNSGCSRELVDEGDPYVVSRRDADHGSWHGSIDGPGQFAMSPHDIPHDLLCY